MFKMHPKVVDITHQLNIVQRLLLLIPAAGISYFITDTIGPAFFESMNGSPMNNGQQLALSLMLIAAMAIPIFQTNKDRTITNLQKIIFLLPTYGVLYIPSGFIVMLMRDMHIVDYRNDEDWWIAVTVMATASVAVFLFKKEDIKVELNTKDSTGEMEQITGDPATSPDGENKITREVMSQGDDAEKQQSQVDHDIKIELNQQLEALEKAYNVGILSKSEYDSKKLSINSRMKDI